MSKTSLKSSLLLFITALIWGVAFVFQSKSMDYMKPVTFMACRNVLASLFLLPVVICKVKKGVNLSSAVKGGVLCGLALLAGDFFQQCGIVTTSVGKTGFITTLYIIFTPILGIFMHKKVPLKVWLCALWAMVGLYFICVTSDSLKISFGDLLVFICAIFFAAHIIIIDVYVSDTDGTVLAFFQFATCAVCSAVLALIFDKPQISQLRDGIIPILYAGIISSGIGYTLQVVGQKGASPVVAALILSLESVISAIAGVIAYKLGLLSGDQGLSFRQILGCAIVFSAVIAVQLPKGRAD